MTLSVNRPAAIDLTDRSLRRIAAAGQPGSSGITGAALPFLQVEAPLAAGVPGSTDPELPAASVRPAGGRGRRVVPTRGWLTWYVAVLLAADALALGIGGLVAVGVRFGDFDYQLSGLPYLGLVLAAVPPWWLTITLSRGYEAAVLGLGSEEYRRVANAVARFTAMVAVLAFALRIELARGMVAVALPVSAVLILAFRYLARQALHRRRLRGGALHRVVVVGEGPSVEALVRRLRGAPYAGLQVVGVCRPVHTGTNELDLGELTLEHVPEAVALAGADTVAVAHSPGITSDVLRRMAWRLEGSKVALLVAPALTDVAGPRISVRPVSGLPLLQVAEPEFTGARRVAKYTLDWLGAIGLVALLGPLMLGAAIAVRLSGPGPVLFRQVRVGRNGRPFTMLKFRSMHADAEQRLELLRVRNDHGDGVMFKMKDDPRVTAVGRQLRRFSIDELPQLFNVLGGRMSMVGPRPALPAEVERYEPDAHRRLLVKPGITGLWQVSGRSELSWAETVRLDLFYVENWSPVLDLEILWKTIFAVVRGAGAH
jgi:exopolysaccharide biosynthesis polyprenyl glycosylphosphotransferase